MEIDKHLDTNDVQVLSVSAASMGLWFLEPIAVILTIFMQTLAIAYLIRKHIKLNGKK